MRFELWSEDVRLGSGERCHASLLEIEARLRRLAFSVAADLPRRPRRKSLAVLDQRHLSRAEQMACFIAQNYTQPLTAETISQHVGLHPNYAMALFQQTSGTTLISTSRSTKTVPCAVTAGDHDWTPILNIALSSGFGSLSRFNGPSGSPAAARLRQYRRLHQLRRVRDGQSADQAGVGGLCPRKSEPMVAWLAGSSDSTIAGHTPASQVGRTPRGQDPRQRNRSGFRGTLA